MITVTVGNAVLTATKANTLLARKVPSNRLRFSVLSSSSH